MSNNAIKGLCVFALVALLLPGHSRAQGTETSRWDIAIAVGYGQRSNPLKFSDDIDIFVDLQIAWYGDHWFFDNGDLGFTLADNDAFTVNLIGRINSDRLFFSRTNNRFLSLGLLSSESPSDPDIEVEKIVVPDRDYAIELGLELLADGDWGQLQLAAHHDVSSIHDGYELYLDYTYGWRWNRWSVRSEFGASWKSKKLNDYYWGVRPEEANGVFAPYKAGAGLNTHARLKSTWQIDERWQFVMAAELQRLNSEATASGFVAERDVLAYFAGLAYVF